MGPVKWRQLVADPRICQRALHKYCQILPLLKCKVERTDQFVVDVRGVKIAAAIVKIDNVLERSESPVVHIGAVQLNVPEGWCFESAIVDRVMGHNTAAAVLSRGANTDVLEPVVGHQIAAVAISTADTLKKI